MGSERRRDERAERLEARRREVGERYSRLPVMDWFRRDSKPERVPGVQLEKGDVLAMILAVLSLVLPWVLALAAAMALAIWLLGQAFKG